MLLVIVPEFTMRAMPTHPQYFVMLNCQRFKAYECLSSCELPLRKILFLSKNRLVCQNLVGIFECSIKETAEKHFKISQDTNGFKINMEGSKLLPFALAEKEDHGQILLTNQSRHYCSDRIEIFSIDI